MRADFLLLGCIGGVGDDITDYGDGEQFSLPAYFSFAREIYSDVCLRFMLDCV